MLLRGAVGDTAPTLTSDTVRQLLRRPLAEGVVPTEAQAALIADSLMSPRWRVLKELGLTGLSAQHTRGSLAMEARDCEVARGQPRPIPADARTLRVIESCDWESWVGDFVAQKGNHAPEPGGPEEKDQNPHREPDARQC